MTREEKLIDALVSARACFQEYGDLHMAKDPPQRGKAWRNFEQVHKINLALTSMDDPEQPEPWKVSVSEAKLDPEFAEKLRFTDYAEAEVVRPADKEPDVVGHWPGTDIPITFSEETLTDEIGRPIDDPHGFRKAYQAVIPILTAAKVLSNLWRDPGRKIDSEEFLHAVNEVDIAITDYLGESET